MYIIAYIKLFCQDPAVCPEQNLYPVVKQSLYYWGEPARRNLGEGGTFFRENFTP